MPQKPKLGIGQMGHWTLKMTLPLHEIHLFVFTAGIHLYAVTFADTENDLQALNDIVDDGNRINVQGSSDIGQKVSEFIDTIASCTTL